MNRTRLQALLLGAALTFFAAVPAAAQGGELAPASGEQEITVLYTNDIHAYLDGPITYSKVAALKDSFENVLLVDAGDHIQGAAYGSMDKGKTVIELMNAAGYDAATPGNHEFDYGMDGRIRVTDEWAGFPYVSANFRHVGEEGPGKTVLPPYEVFEAGGVKVAFLGITTPESVTKSLPTYFRDETGRYIYEVTAGEALYADVQRAIDAAEKEADVIIALGHLGNSPDSSPNTSREVIANTVGLDGFIDGHSHAVVPLEEVRDQAGNPVILTQTGEYFGAVGKLTLTAGGITSATLLTDLSGVEPDPAVKAMEEAWMDEVDAMLGEEIGFFEDTLDNYDAEGNRLVRLQETNSGDFAADALYHLFDSMGMEVDAAVMNAGGVRNGAVTGTISYLTCKEIHPFINVACLQTVTGQQLLDGLEWGARTAGSAENGGFLHVSGLKYTVDLSVPSTVRADDKGVWCGPPTGEYRVKNVMIRDRETGAYVPVDPQAEYDLAGYSYTLRHLGDGFAMFEGSVNRMDNVAEAYMVLANYVLSFDGGRVSGYAAPEGRITILPASAGESRSYTVVPGDSLWKIAAECLGSGARWSEIYERNRERVKDPDRIYVGQVLTLPAA